MNSKSKQKPKTKKINLEKDKLEIAKFLSEFHVLFRMFYDAGDIVFSDKIPTAAVTFNQDGQYVEFLFNQEYYESLDLYNKCFTVAHEMLHLVLEHGKRTKPLVEKGRKDKVDNRTALNCALDIPINEMLVSHFGFKRSKIENEEKLCWINTVFKDRDDVEADKSFEYYYDKLPKSFQKQYKLVDAHSFLDQKDGEGQQMSDFIADSGVLDYLSDEDLDKLKEAAGEKSDEENNNSTSGEGKNNSDSLLSRAGSGGGCYHKVNKVNVRQKPRWENLVYKWTRRKIVETFSTEIRWDRPSRRFAEVLSLNKDIFLATESKILSRGAEDKKLDVFFLLDTSGSCISLKDRFMAMAKTLPKDKFNVLLHSFDTSVAPIDNPESIYGGGGTSFRCIEEYIQQQLSKKKLKKYPEAVWVMTDGYGDNVQPKFPERWKFLLSCDYKGLIPKKSSHYLLKDFI